MPRRCALGCTPSKGVLHVFPNPNKFPEQFKAWVQVVSGQDKCDFDYTKLRICERHFTERNRNLNNRLNAIAVPTLFLHEHHAVQISSEPSASMSFMTLSLPEVSRNDQLLSDNPVPKPCASPSSSPKMDHLGTFNVEESFSGTFPKVSQDPLLEHNYCKPCKKTHAVRKWKKNLISAETSKKQVTYQRNIKNLRRLIDRLRKRGKDVKSRLENAENLFQKYSFDSMLTRNFNQDPVENCFGNIRNCGARNTAPNVLTFEGSFKSLLLNNLNAPHSAQANCEEDTNSFLQTLSPKKNNTAPEIDVSKENEITITSEILNYDKIPNDLGQRNYVCSWVLRKCLKNIIKTCKTCRNTLLISENTENNSSIEAKEFFYNKKVHPLKQLIECFHSIQNICVSRLRKDVPKTGLKKEIKMLTEIFVNFPIQM